MDALRLEAVTASYRTASEGPSASQAARKPAGGDAQPAELCDVTLSVAEGQIVAVLGPNGAGKTTLVRVVAGLLRPRHGRVLLEGKDIEQMDRQEHARLVAVVPQRVEVALGFSVAEVVAMGRAPHQGAWQRSRREDAAAVSRALQICELELLAERPVSALSGGEQKRVHIARAIAQQARVLVLDEAAAHLDIRHALGLHALVRAEVSERGLACVAVMHDLDAAARIADRVVLLRAGRLVADGPALEVMQADRLEATFDTPIHVGSDAPDGKPTFLPLTRSFPTESRPHRQSDL